MLRMVFEVIQPDLEINRRHAATLLLPLTASVCEPLRAVPWGDSGKFWQRRSRRPSFDRHDCPIAGVSTLTRADIDSQAIGWHDKHGRMATRVFSREAAYGCGEGRCANFPTSRKS